jgi:hypothetical protein
MSDQNAPLKHYGTAIFMDGREWIVPALGVRQAREHLGQLIKFAASIDNTPEGFNKMVDEVVPILHMAFQRNYPEMTQDQLLDILDMRTFFDVMKAVMAQSGVTQAAPGE